MKKKIFGGMAVLAIATAVALNVNLSTKDSNLLNLSLANVEILAWSESRDTYYKTYDSSDSFHISGNCLTVTTSVRITCISGGYDACSPDSFSYTTKHCR